MKRQLRLCALICVSLLACTRPEAPPDASGGKPSSSALTPSEPASSVSALAPSSTIALPVETASAPTVAPAWFHGGGTGSSESRLGMVSSVEDHATRAGVSVLEAGGNAVDAAVAVGYALAVTHPNAGNIAGGGFMLIHAPGQATVSLDFRERAPLASSPAHFKVMLEHKAQGPLAAGVPGSVAGLNAAHQRFGKLPRSEVMAPAIALARDGFPLGKRQADTLRWAWPRLKLDAEAKRIFGRSGRRAALEPKRQGETLLQPDLARTLQRIADHGDEGFYQGETAAALERAMQQQGGILTRADLSAYRAVFREPLQVDYRGLRVEVMGPPSAGGVAVISMLAMLQELKAYEQPRESSASFHLLAEVAKRAHAERRFAVVDPDSVEDYDAAARLTRWQDPAVWLRPFPIDLGQATKAETLHPLYRSAQKELDHTTHFSVVDKDGMVVSCTTTLSASFGAKVVVPGLGIVLNNSYAAFSTAGENTPLPGRRMTSSMSPTLVFYQEQPVLVLGSPGGDTIPNTVVQVLRNVVDYGLTLSEAIDAPRVHHGFVPDEIRYESARPPAPTVLRDLRKLGHALSAPLPAMGDANNLMLWRGTFYGYADPREGGLALGPSR